MQKLFRELRERKEFLQNLSLRAQKELEESPEGKLRVSNIKGKPRYYHVAEGLKGKEQYKERYIGKKDRDIACRLAQKEYVQKLQKRVNKELNTIESYLNKYKNADLEKLYEDLNEYRKDLVKPWLISDKMYVDAWEKEEYISNPFYPEEKIYSTKRDELVRSKSEVMLADLYYELGIPYRYEAELVLGNGKRKYPDFTLLDIRNRTIIYHEHLGLMDNQEYVQNNLMKLTEYQKNGIYPGKNLILSYESENCYLNIKLIRKMLRELFLEG